MKIGASVAVDDDPKESVTNRQELISGYEQKKLSRANVLVVGAGGIGSEITEGLVRKGVGKITICDHDTVSQSNLSRQHFFAEQIHKNKAHCLVENLQRHSTCGTVLEGWSIPFQDMAASNLVDFSSFDLAIVGVDNSATRIASSEYFRDKCPVVFCAVDLAGEAGAVTIQEPGKACFGCIHGVSDTKIPCQVPAVKDTIKAISGAVLYAVDTLLMPNRKRSWNRFDLHLAGFMPSSARTVEKNPHCPLCGNPTPTNEPSS